MAGGKTDTSTPRKSANKIKAMLSHTPDLGELKKYWRTILEGLEKFHKSF